MLPDPKWRDEAIAYYRTIFEGLAELPKPTTVLGEYLVEEIRDALFDLKQAVIEYNPDFARRAAREIRDIVKIIDHRLQEGHDL